MVRSFPVESAGGPDGIRPQHMFDPITCKEVGITLLLSLTILMKTSCWQETALSRSHPYYLGYLVRTEKEVWGLSPIAIGYYWCRLASKCANNDALSQLSNYF